MRGFVKLAPMLDKVIVGFVVCATNLYHTSVTTPVAQFGPVKFVGVVSVEP
jgi:hypothetical protein